MSSQMLTTDEQVIMLQKYVAEGARDIDLVSSLVGQVIESGAWASFTDQLGNPIEHPSFQSFVTTPRWRGMGTTKAALVAWVREQDEATAEQVEKAWRGEIAAMPRKGEVGKGRASVRCGGTTPNEADGILARLKRDDPTLAARVVAGEVSPNAAALIKGWRKPRVLLTSPESVASAVRKHWTPEQIAELRDLL